MIDRAFAPNVAHAWRHRFSIRTRLTVAFTALLTVAGTAIVLIVTVFMRTVPAYETVKSYTGDSTDLEKIDLALPDPDSGKAAPSEWIVLRDTAGILNTSLIVSLIALALLVFAGAVAAWAISGRMLRPLQAINQAAQLASTGSLDHRIGLTGPKDELRDLSNTFDMMLTRLDDAFQAHQRFAANASHELRTPLAVTETMLEVALDDPDISIAELRGVASRVLETNRRNAQTVEALLALAEIGSQPINNDPVNIDRLLSDILAVAREEADAKGIDITVAMRATVVFGDETLLRQALTNLIHNAIRHNHPGGLVEITMAELPAGATIRIENTGLALTKQRIAELQEPFARGAGRIEGGRRGHGLGIAIAATAIESHGGVLHLLPRPAGGLVAHVAVPISSRDDHDESQAARQSE